MKRPVLIIAAVVVLLILAFVGYRFATTKSHSPSQTVSVDKDDLKVAVTYSRPYKKGRLIFGDENDKALVPFGQYWRLGANEATEITFSKEVEFAGTKVPAGQYRIYAIPGKDQWELRLNSELGKWGYAEPDYSKDVFKVTVPRETNSEAVEQFTILLKEQADYIEMQLIWDTTLIRVPIKTT